MSSEGGGHRLHTRLYANHNIMSSLWCQYATRRRPQIQLGKLPSIRRSQDQLKPSHQGSHKHKNLTSRQESPRTVPVPATKRPKGQTPWQVLVAQEAARIEIRRRSLAPDRARLVQVQLAERHEQLAAEPQGLAADGGFTGHQSDAHGVVGVAEDLVVGRVEVGAACGVQQLRHVHCGGGVAGERGCVHFIADLVEELWAE